jgi:very-short-patch-repair endonuclease
MVRFVFDRVNRSPDHQKFIGHYLLVTLPSFIRAIERLIVLVDQKQHKAVANHKRQRDPLIEVHFRIV